MAALRGETVERNRWLGPTQFGLAYALSRFTPGTNMLAFSTALGWQLRGMSGAVVALIASSLPCSIVTVAMTIAIDAARGNRWAMLAIDGAAASTVGIVAASCWQLMRPHSGSGEIFRTVALVAGATLLQLADVAPVRILLIAAIVGALWRERR